MSIAFLPLEIIKPGTLITCPKCHAEIARFKESLQSGTVLRPESLELIQEGHVTGGPMHCMKCNTAFGRNVIHTSEGWR